MIFRNSVHLASGWASPMKGENATISSSSGCSMALSFASTFWNPLPFNVHLSGCFDYKLPQHVSPCIELDLASLSFMCPVLQHAPKTSSHRYCFCSCLTLTESSLRIGLLFPCPLAQWFVQTGCLVTSCWIEVDENSSTIQLELRTSNVSESGKICVVDGGSSRGILQDIPLQFGRFPHTEEEGSLEAGGWPGHGSFRPHDQQKCGRRWKTSPRLARLSCIVYTPILLIPHKSPPTVFLISGRIQGLKAKEFHPFLSADNTLERMCINNQIKTQLPQYVTASLTTVTWDINKTQHVHSTYL